VSSVALFCSVRCQTSGRAASLASGILLLFFLSGPLLSSVSGLSGVSWITPEVSRLCSDLYQQQQSASVITRLLDIFRTTGGVSFFSAQFVSNIAASVVLFLLSVALFNRYSEPVEDTTHGTSVRVRRHTVGRCWSAPLVWKDFLFMTGGKPFFIVKLVAYALLACGFAWFNRHQHNWHGEWLNAELTSTALRTVIGFLTVEALLYSSNSLFLEVRQQAIGPLRMVPIPTSVALFQKAAACFIAMLPGMMTALALIIYRPSVLWSDRGVAEQTIAWLFVVFVSTHLTVLLSLYVRWAALPLAVLATSISFGCFVPLIMGMNAITRSVAAVNGIPFHVWTGVAVNFVWLWLFVLLPIEIEIVRRWNTLSGE
ncbi:MAG: hypothetical protein KDA81_14820, partial [Planctomycetaceae bacterium]|nr:hypothetical protein [Planctomycetaceae bacterium]